MSSHNRELGVFQDVKDLVKSPRTKTALALAGILAFGANNEVNAQNEVTPDPNVRYTTEVTRDQGANLRSLPSATGRLLETVADGTRLEVSVTGITTADGVEWLQVWEINDVPVENTTYVARFVVGDLTEVDAEEAPAVAAPEAPEEPGEVETQPASTDAPQTVEVATADGTMIEVTPVMQSTEEYATAHAETESFEFVKQQWLAGGELGPFNGVPPILFMQSGETLDLAGNISPFIFNTNSLYTLEYGGQEYQFNGVDALRLTLMQAIAATNGEIHSAQDFEDFMAGFAQGEGTQGEVTGMNWETGEREVFEFDATQPVTIMVRGLYNESDRSADLDELGLKYTQWGVFNHYSNQQGGLVIEMWLFDTVGLNGRLEQDPRTASWTLGRMLETGIAVLPTTANPLDGDFGIDLNGVFRPYNPDYRMGERYETSADIFDNVDEGGEASYERFLPLFTMQAFRFEEFPIHMDDSQS